MTNHEQPPHTERADQQPGEPTIEQRIEEGISAAHEAQREIDLTTAMTIAEALARAVGDDSSLARFGDTGVSSYLALREEYLDLYNDPDTPADVKRWIDWLGTFLVQRESTGSGRRFMNEHLDPKLDRVLTRTALPIQDQKQRAYVPATLSAKEIIRLAARIEAMEEYTESAFRAFLTLPDVNAADPALLDSFRESHVGSWPHLEDAVRDLAELDSFEEELGYLASARGFPNNAVTIEYEIIKTQLREMYDIVQEGWQVHVFSK